MSYQIEYSCFSHIGKIRSMNQDNFICNGVFALPNETTVEFPLTDTRSLKEPCLLGVFDGMGGEERGEMASYIAAKEASFLPLTGESVSLLGEYCHFANLAICQYIQDHNLGSMGTTAAMLLFYKNNITLCNIGDSKIFRLSGETFEQISTDHVAMAPFGVKPPLSQNLGIPPEWMQLEPYFSKGECHKGDRYLICSDGLTDMVSPEEIQELLTTTPIAEAASVLTEKALENGGKDNITIIAVEIKSKKKGLFSFGKR